MTALNQDAVKQVLGYRKRGLSFREIAKLMSTDVKQVYRWFSYSVGTYPQKNNKKVLTVDK
jgi:DNA invertase Pin-like site-specific DNA recombinase